VRRIL